MIVLIIDEDSVLAFKLKSQPPVSADADRPVTFEFSSQRMKLPSRSVHVSRLPCVIQGKQLQSQFASVFRLNPSFRPGVEKLFDAPMPEAFNHMYSVALRITHVNR